MILSVGEGTARRLAAARGFEKLPVFPIGTHRAPAAAAAARETWPLSVLVIPEGLTDECVRLFSCALDAARLAPDIRFVLRTHPVLPFERLHHALPSQDHLPANVELSRSGPLEAEFTHAGFCLYRGSSAAVYATLAGLQPFYLEMPGELTLDPMHDLDVWRQTVNGPRTFVDRVRAAASAGAEARSAEWRRAAAHLHRYAQPFSETVLDEFLTFATRFAA